MLNALVPYSIMCLLVLSAFSSNVTIKENKLTKTLANRIILKKIFQSLWLLNIFLMIKKYRVRCKIVI
ncbi:hypothetical protein BMS3Bbin09_00005 [bacterium BMS3Bbin09]|nr:hypothetical protein BMS3Bbin09_00005 [bacterium BMS3Bbin09]